MRSNSWQHGGSYAYLVYAGIASLLLAIASIATPTQALAAAGDELLTIGQTYYNSGDLNNAITTLERFVTEYPSHKSRNKGELYLGCSYLNRNSGTTDLVASRNHFNFVLNQGKKAECYRDAFFHNARSYYDGGDYATAKTLLLQFESEYPNDSFLEYVYYYLGVCETKIGSLEQALNYYTTFETKYPTSNLIWYAKLDKATIEGRLGRYQQADQQLASLAADAKAPANVVGMATNQRALLMAAQGNTQGAISLLDDFIQKNRYNRSDAELLSVLQASYIYEAHAYFMLKDYNKALSLVNEVEALNESTPPDALTLKIKILLAQKRTTEAETVLNTLSNSQRGLQQPDLITSYRALIDLAMGRYDQVVSSLSVMLSPRAINTTSTIVEFHYYDSSRNHLSPIGFVEACGILTIAYAARYATNKNQTDYNAADAIYQATARYVDSLKSPAANLVLSAINTARLDAINNPNAGANANFAIVAPNSTETFQTNGFTPPNQTFMPQNPASNIPVLPNSSNTGNASSMRPTFASGVTVNQQGFLVNQNGQYVDPNGRVITTQGFYYNANGQLVNAQGQLVNTNGQPIDASGQTGQNGQQPKVEILVNQQGQLVNSQNLFVTTTGQILTTPGQYFNSYGQLVNGSTSAAQSIPNGQQYASGILVNNLGQLVNSQNQLVNPEGQVQTVAGSYYSYPQQLAPTGQPTQQQPAQQPDQQQSGGNQIVVNQETETPLTPKEARSALIRATGFYENLEFDRANQILLETMTKSETFWSDCPAEAARIALLRANALLELGKRSEARMTCHDLVTHAPNTQEASVAYYYLGSLADSVGRGEEAIRNLRLATAGRGDFPYADVALYLLGANELERGEVNTAAHTFGRLYRDYPKSPYWSHGVWQLAKIEADLRNDIAAEKLVNEALARRPDSAIIDYLLFLKGEIALRAKDYDKALIAFDMIIDQYPRSVWYAHAKNRLTTIPQRFLYPNAKGPQPPKTKEKVDRQEASKEVELAPPSPRNTVVPRTTEPRADRDEEETSNSRTSVRIPSAAELRERASTSLELDDLANPPRRSERTSSSSRTPPSSSTRN